jgi:hypothetical protein
VPAPAGLELDPNDPDALSRRGAAYLDLGRDQEALRDFDQALQLDPDDAFALKNRGAAYLTWAAPRRPSATSTRRRSLIPTTPGPLSSAGGCPHAGSLGSAGTIPRHVGNLGWPSLAAGWGQLAFEDARGMILQVGSVRAIPSKRASYGVLGRWRGPLRFLEVLAILAGPMHSCMCYCRVRRRSR